MKIEELNDLIYALQTEARDADNAYATFESSQVTGMMNSYFKSMWLALPDDHFLKEYIPQKLAEHLDVIQQRQVMKKLET